MPKEYFNPPDLFQSLQYGFSQVVTATPGKMVFLSGQVAWDSQQHLVGGMDLRAQTIHALHNVEEALSIAGACLSDIVTMRLYIVDYDSQKAPQITGALKAVFREQDPPACTWIGVSALANEGFLIEIEATAVIDEGA